MIQTTVTASTIEAEKRGPDATLNLTGSEVVNLKRAMQELPADNVWRDEELIEMLRGVVHQIAVNRGE